MAISKFRYLGRLTGLGDALAMKKCGLSPDDYYKLSRDEMVLATARGIGGNEAIVQKLMELAGDAELPPSSLFEEQEYKIGLREGMMLVRNNENLSRLTLPIEFWHK